MTANYPLNCWYVAAASDEVDRQPLSRRLLDRPVVLYRREAGGVAALEDRCAHRTFPLSHGALDGDRLVCGYHGFTFDPEGALVGVASQERVPPHVCVRSYPVVEEPPLVWIWLGHPAGARLRRPPRLPWLHDDGWAAVAGRHGVAANFLRLHEHYLDLTYALVVHEDAPPGLDAMPTADRVEVSETSVSSLRVLPPLPLADWESEATGLPRDTAYARREHSTFVSPGVHVGRWQIETTGDSVFEIARLQAFTPETASSTHAFWWIARNFATERDLVGKHLRDVFSRHADDHRGLVEQAQAHADLLGDLPEVNVKADAAALKARRIVRTMLAGESVT